MTARENLLRAIRRENPRWVPNGLENTIVVYPPVVERPAAAGCDAWGVRYNMDDKMGTGTFPAQGGHVIRGIETWREDVHVPNVEAMDFSKLYGGGRLLKKDEIDRDEYLVMGFVEFGIFERSYLLFGMEDALINYLQEPEVMESIAALIADYKIALIQKFHNALPLDMIWYGDDWGTQLNLFMPVETWRSIIGKHTARIYRCMQELGIIINQHSCGKVEAVFGDMVAMGADMWNPCQPCNDLAVLKKTYGGSISFCGGIDSQFVLDRRGVTPEEVRAEVRKRIDEMAGGGGYIAAPSHSVPFDKALIDAMNDEIRAYGVYPLAGWLD
jgi:uroporphyrinogen decarboxylase